MDNYDVFVSFRGADTRTKFVSHLYTALVEAGIHVFLDNEELTYGRRLAVELPQAINNSKIYIPVLSKTYASSTWCLRELAEIVRNKQEFDQEKEILPVFYEVTVEDVKLKTDVFKKDLNSHLVKEGVKKVEEWTKALRCIPGRRGWHVPIYGSKGDAEFCREIVRRVAVILKVRQKQVSESIFGMENPVKKVMELLDLRTPGVQVVGIHGIGGIGKTTLAKVVYNYLCDNSFDCCSFLNGIRESLDEDKGSKGCLELQKKLLKDVSRQGRVDDIKEVDDGVRIIQRTLKGKRVLMVFDDVSTPSQIETLIGDPYKSFGLGSRIIITTKDVRNVQLKTGWVHETYEVEELKREDALKLFSWFAFRQLSPPEQYQSLSDVIVNNLTGGLPLALDVIGSLLYKRSKVYWQTIIQKLHTLPDKGIQNKLMVSYEDLSDETKEIFLDIVCFFVNKERTYEEYMWEACQLFPVLGIDELVSMSLIKIKEGKYWMHDHIKELGREIVRQEVLRKKCSRFWMKTDAIDVLTKRNAENSTIEAICLLDVERSDVGAEIWTLRRGNFAGLEKLRFLQMNNKYPWLNNNKPIKLKLEGAFEGVFPSLRWLSWHNVPEQFNVTGLNFKKLIILDLSYSDITEAWPGWKEIKDVPSLEVLDLTSCKGLKKTPELTHCTSLKRLVLNDCSNLEEIDCTIVNLKALQYLHFNGCYSLKRLPAEVFTLSQLKEITGRFDDRYHESMSVIPESVAHLTSLVTLKLHRLQMIALPAAIGELVSLQLLDLKLNVKLQSLPESIGGLVKLEDLLLDTCTGLVHLPYSLTSMAKLQRLVLHNCENLGNLPDSIGEMTLLKEFDISGTAVKKLPRFIAMQKELEKLNAEGSKLEGVPTEIEDLACLKVVNFRGCLAICGLPCLSKLTRLEELNMESCNHLEQPLEFPSSLVKLYIPVASLQSIPNLSSLTNLTNLKLILKARKIDHQSTEIELMDGLQCFRTSSIDRLFKLKELYLSIQGFTTTISEEFVNLPQLEKLTLLCSELEACIIPFPSGLRTINLSIRKGTVSLSLPRLNNLTHFKLSNTRDLAQISGLGEQESLRSLKITCCDSLKKLDVSKLRQLTFLKIIKCKRLRVIRVQDLKSLEKLLILGCESLESLVGFSGSESETVQDDGNVGNAKSIEGFNSLEDMSVSKLEALKVVRIEDCQMIRGLQHLKGFECLRSLQITNCTSLEGLFDLSESRCLTQVVIECCTKLMDIPGLEALVSLEKLAVAGCNLLERLSDLSKLQKLERIHVVECKTLVEIPGLGELESLRVLEIKRCNSLHRLNIDGLKRLEELCIEHCKNLKDIGSCDYDYLELSLKQLKVCGCPLLEDKFPDKLKMIMVPYDKDYDGDEEEEEEEEEEDEEPNEVVQITGTNSGDRRKDESLAIPNSLDVSLSGELMNHCPDADADEEGVVDLSETAAHPRPSPSILRVDHHPLPANDRLSGSKRHASVEVMMKSTFLSSTHDVVELAQGEDCTNNSLLQEPERTTIVLRGSCFNFTELTQTKNLNDFSTDLSSSSTTLYGVSNDPSSAAAEESAIYEQFQSLLFNDIGSPSASSLSLEAADTNEAKVVLENFFSGGIKMLENASVHSLGPVLAAAKVLSLKNPNDSAFWDGFYSKLPRAALSYNLSIEKIQAAEAVHARYAELQESGKKTLAHLEALKDSEAYVSASKQMTLSQITSLRAQLAELEKKVAEADLQLDDVTSQQHLVLGTMKAQITVLKATNQDLPAKDAERDIFQEWLLSLQADWNAWKAHLH